MLILRFCTMKTRTSILTPGDSSSPASRVKIFTSWTIPQNPAHWSNRWHLPSFFCILHFEKWNCLNLEYETMPTDHLKDGLLLAALRVVLDICILYLLF